MKALIVRTLIAGGMLAGAFAAGSVLGNFTTAGLVSFDAAANGASADFTTPLDIGGNAADTAAGQAAAATPPDEPIGNHVCQGCDARSFRAPEAADYAYDDTPLPQAESEAPPQALAAFAPPLPASAPSAPSLPKLRQPGAIPATGTAP